MRDICQQFVCSEFRKSLKVEDNYHDCFSLVRTDPKWGSVEVSVWEGVTGVESDAPSMMAAQNGEDKNIERWRNGPQSVSQ